VNFIHSSSGGALRVLTPEKDAPWRRSAHADPGELGLHRGPPASLFPQLPARHPPLAKAKPTAFLFPTPTTLVSWNDLAMAVPGHGGRAPRVVPVATFPSCGGLVPHQMGSCGCAWVRALGMQ
jgi:hypothetical protein